MLRFLVLLGALCVTSFACGAKDEAAREKIVTPVRVRQVEEQAQLAGARYSGTVEPGTRVDLAFKVGGYIRDLAQIKQPSGPPRKVQEGDFVTKGTVLAVVRESDYEQRVGAATAAASESVAAQKQAQLDFDRTQKLMASSSVAKVELDNQGARLESAVARVDGAKSRIREAEISLAD